ncbi:hypothetical protein [Vineibacter terrae]|uniref:hypothetical protein n=1 Tax=Vineibacter terrae TaxID=2586908 RepID=UPI002E369C08|nr:hypothetical protein [Vineibacter terrae]HEX2889338.1 hypothetical protein [Vineibacter terrae]
MARPNLASQAGRAIVGMPRGMMILIAFTVPALLGSAALAIGTGLPSWVQTSPSPSSLAAPSSPVLSVDLIDCEPLDAVDTTQAAATR